MTLTSISLGFPGGSDGEESALPMQETWVRPLGREDPLQKGMATHSSVLAWRIHGQKSLVGYRAKGSIELDMTKAT